MGLRGVFCCFLLIGSTSFVRADFTLDIVGGSDTATPIAVVPFGGPNLDDNPGYIINNDLKYSGVFKTVDAINFPSHPVSSSEVFYHDWAQVGSDYLVVGNTSEDALGLYEMHYELLSIHSKKRIFGETLTLNASQWRDAAHQIADHIYQKITGVRGAFATRIAYVERHADSHGLHYALRIADSDGHRAQTILASDASIISPSWSPDAEKIAYVSFESGRSIVYVQNLRTRARQRVAAFDGINGAPAWSPDGKTLAMALSRSGNPEIWLLDVASGHYTQLTHDASINTEPCWYPDGQHLAFTSDRGGFPQIYKVSRQGGDTQRISFDGNYNASCAISPDGSKMAVVHREKGQTFQIAIQDLGSGEMSVLSQSRLDRSPSFAPNGNMLVYATLHQNQGMLALISPDGRVKVLLPEQQGEAGEPAWSPFLH